ncbi:hypothetical protein LAZ67_3002894 [Cordylochernes scorpioides]|uniref:Transposase n=1 Tax=Cordylochernes scorpioides TaxID=51811 RepID=A0ABY6K9X7_9ARAC|nr:hypothetical protein LAZ67_3002894 [Cordylochernes scorpioides]
MKTHGHIRPSLYNSIWLNTEIALLLMPPYSSDLALNEFFHYPKIKKVLKGHLSSRSDMLRFKCSRAIDEVPGIQQ